MPAKLDLPPPLLDEETGGDAGWVELTKAANDIHAHLITGRLDAAGIESRFVKDRSSPGAWLHGGSDPWGPSAIFVRRIQLEDARMVLAEVSFDAPSVDPPRPIYRHTRRVPTSWWLIALILGILLTGVALLNTAGAIRANCDLPLVCGGSSSPHR